MNLVVDHVLESLVVGRPEEDLGVELATRVPRVHHLGFIHQTNMNAAKPAHLDPF